MAAIARGNRLSCLVALYLAGSSFFLFQFYFFNTKSFLKQYSSLDLSSSDQLDKSLVRQQDDYEDEGRSKNGNDRQEPEMKRSEDDICYPLPPVVPHATVLWKQHLSDIFAASKHPYDVGWEFHDWTALLLHRLPPLRLMKSVKTLPEIESMRPILETLQRRRKYYETPPDMMPSVAAKDRSAPPPLNILVMGGSVTMGVMCRINPVLNQMGKYGRQGCAWPLRLERMINNMFGFPAVKIEAVAVGGTNTEIATLLYEYGLIQKTMPNPDIIINSYSTNDMHYNTIQSAESKNKTLEELAAEMIENFIRVVKQPSPCDPRNKSPLLIFLDDYLGNEQKELWDIFMYNRILTSLASYYNVMTVSYADMVRHFVHGDTKETWFSPQWYDGAGKYIREVHPGVGAHTAIAWAILFNIFNAITIFCSGDTSSPQWDNIDTMEYEEGKHRYTSDNGMPELKGDKFYRGEPHPMPNALPPPLAGDVLMENVSELWRDASEEAKAVCETSAKNSTSKINRSSTPCVFSWVGNFDDIDTEENLREMMSTVVTSNNGWTAQADHNKVGYVPTGGLNSTFTLEIPELIQPVRTVSLLAMKSYGDKWQDSLVRVSVYIVRRQVNGTDEDILASEMLIEGFHESRTSVSYPFKIHLKDKSAVAGNKIKVGFELIGGTTFKITGLALCDSS